MGEKMNAYGILVEKPDGKKPLKRLIHKWDSIIMDLREIRRNSMEWINLV
jgi:hypothetical protein